MPDISFFLVLAALIIFIFVLLFISDTKRKLARTEFLKIAEKFKLECDSPTGFLAKFPEIKGKYKGYPIRIYMFTEKYGEGKSKVIRVHTAIDVDIKNPLGYTLDVYEEGFFNRIYKVFGMQDIVIGNERFDKEYIVKSNDEEITRNVLKSHICDQLLYLADHKFAFGFEISKNKIHYDEASSITSEKKIEWFMRILNMMVDLAIEVEDELGKQI